MNTESPNYEPPPSEAGTDLAQGRSATERGMETETRDDVRSPGTPASSSSGGAGSTLVARPKTMVMALVVSLVLAVSGVAGYRLLTSSESDDDALDARSRDASADPEAVDGDATGGGGQRGEARAGGTDPLGDGWLPPAWSLIATLTEDVPSYQKPGGESDGTVSATWHGRQSALAVVQERPRWLRVRVQDRPNGSTAWVRRRDVEVSSTPFYVRIDLASTRLQLWERAELVMDVPVGVGTSDAPTPTGDFFVSFLQEPPDDGGNWGPFVMVTSGHSEAISDFQLSGDAITGIHGPLGAAEQIRNGGARVSKGCVRLQQEDLKQLRDVPAGSPIEIIDTSTGTGTTA